MAGKARHKDQCRLLVELAQVPGCGKAIDPGHLDVHEDKVGGMALGFEVEGRGHAAHIEGCAVLGGIAP